MTITLNGTTGINTPGVVNTAAETVATTLTVTGVSTLTGGFTVGATAAPAFSAYLLSGQSISAATFTKVTINTETFDTNSNFDSTTNYRFQPTVAGYYQINGSVQYNAVGTNNIASIYKNGSEINRGNQGGVTQVVVSCLVSMNGSSDYLELYGYSTLAATINSGSSTTYFQAAMVRSA
jgi:hypothetical protein